MATECIGHGGDCTDVAVAAVKLPGRPPLPMCTTCSGAAARIADALGFDVEILALPDASPAAVADSSSAPATSTIDTANHFIVSRSSKGIAVLKPPLAGWLISDAEALNLAAWLVAMVERGPDRLAPVMRAVLRT